MKITKRQLKRIIKEANTRVLAEASMIPLGAIGNPADQALQDYQSSIYDNEYRDLEGKLEDVIYSALGMYQEVNGVSEEEAAQLVIGHVKEILGMSR